MISVPGWLIVLMAIVDFPGLLFIAAVIIDVIIQIKEEHDWRKWKGDGE